MKCQKCKYKNSYKAKYCYSCGYSFSKKEREDAKNNGIIKVLKKIKKMKDTISLSFITSKTSYQICSIVLLLLIALAGILIDGIHLKLMESENYTYQYNKKDEEYYVYTKENETKLNLYAFGSEANIEVSYYDELGNILEKNTYDSLENIVLNANATKNNYYRLNYKNDSLKLYVYKT